MTSHSHINTISRPAPARQGDMGSLEGLMLLLTPFLMLYSVLAARFPNFQKDFLGGGESAPPTP